MGKRRDYMDLALAGVLIGVGVITLRMEHLMADFSALNTKLDEQDAARGAALERINADIQDLKAKISELQVDAGDQAQVDAVVTRLQQNIDALNSVDPVRADDNGAPTGGTPAEPGEGPVEEPTPAEPTEPAAGGNA